MVKLEFVRGHVEVYRDGKFWFSADTRSEAEEELEEPPERPVSSFYHTYRAAGGRRLYLKQTSRRKGASIWWN